MRNAYLTLMKKYLHKQLRKTRKQMGITQLEASEILEMDLRSYSYIETGVHMCGALSFALFLIYMCPNPEKILNDLRKIFEKAKEESSNDIA